MRLRDVRDCRQRENGLVLNVDPHVQPADPPMDILNGSCGWADASVIISYTLWKATGDEEVIRENYDLMHGWKEYTGALCQSTVKEGTGSVSRRLYGLSPVRNVRRLGQAKKPPA